MEINEGSIRVGSRPYVTVGDKPLKACKPNEIEKAFLELMKRCAQLRETNEHLTQRLATAWAEHDKAKEELKNATD